MITIDEAIRRLNAYVRWRKPDLDDNFHEAVSLGIEALKELEKLRNSGILGAWKPLPGETEGHG